MQLAVLKFGLDPIYSFGDIVIFIFCRFGWKLPIHAHFFRGIVPQIWSPIILTPKRPSLRRNTSFELQSVKIFPAVRPGRRIEKKVRTGQHKTGQSKKAQGGNISPILGEDPTEPIEIKICMAGKLAYVITCAKFEDEIFRGYNFTGGRISHFPIDFCL